MNWSLVIGIGLACLLLGAYGCSKGSTVVLYAEPDKAEPGQPVQVGVRLENPPANVEFRWKSSRGTCEPSSSKEVPYTTFSSAEIGQTVVTAEIWSGTRMVFIGSVRVQILPAEQLRAPPSSTNALPEAPSSSERPTITITSEELPFDPIGGPETSTHIEGKVSGPDPTKYKVVIYALTDMWYVQPLIAEPFTSVGRDGVWSTSIHRGQDYAALLVEESFTPRPQTRNLESIARAPGVLGVAKKPGRRR